MSASEIIGRTKIKCIDIEIAVAHYFSWRVNLIVPNVSWGMFIHECDLLIVTKAGYCYEIEIKTSRSDLKADMQKRHGHQSKIIKKLYFAIPDYLSDCIEFIPARAGIITVSAQDRCKCIREPEIMQAPKLTDNERFQVARLGTMRIWVMKEIVRRKLWEAAITSPNTPMAGEAPQICEAQTSP
jgi:hypothetical protein